MGKDLNELASYMLPLAIQLLDNCLAIGIPCRVIDTGRTMDEQTTKIVQRVSWTLVSKHEAQPPEGKSEALDICPQAILEENKADWDPENPLWNKIGEEGKKLGLSWGGDWKHHPDPSHFEYKHVVQT